MVAIQRLVVLNLFLLRFTLSNNNRHMVRAFQHSDARPIGAGKILFIMAPPSTKHSFT